jgi:hypothetical protein
VLLGMSAMAYKGRINTKETERHYPHIVELMVPLNGFAPKLNAMHEWHSTRGIQSQRGSGRYHKGRHYVRWCFAGPEDAKAFQAEFGGKLIRLMMR